MEVVRAAEWGPEVGDGRGHGDRVAKRACEVKEKKREEEKREVSQRKVGWTPTKLEGADVETARAATWRALATTTDVRARM